MLSQFWDYPDIEIISQMLNHGCNNHDPWSKDEHSWNKWKYIFLAEN